MKDQQIILAGGSGFLGHLLARHLQTSGWQPVILTRKRQGLPWTEVIWDGRTIGDWTSQLDGAAAIVNLSGRSVNCRFTPENMRAVMDSRVESTRVIGDAIALCKRPPGVWLNSSTATIYRHTFGPAHDESSEDFAATPEVKDGYSVEVAQAWERSLNEARTPATRKVALRTTLVFGTAAGGVFEVLRRLTRLRLGGRMASGRQFVSWIHENDFCRAIEWLLKRGELGGPVNLAAPEPLTNAGMMSAFREVCGVRIGLPAARWMLEIGAWVMRTETELILKSRRVIPAKLLASGFAFEFQNLKDALRDLEARTAAK